jgi:hypothetical protein
MFCPHCGKENAGPFGYCIVCGKPLSMVESAPVFSPAPPPAPPKSLGLLGILGMGAAVALAVVVAFTKPIDENGTPADLQGFRIGTLFGMLLLPFAIAFVFAGRKKVRNPNRFALIFCLVCVLVAGFSWVSSLSFEAPEQRIGRLAREAAGLQPERHSGFSRQRRFDDAVRNQYRNLVQQNRSYSEAVKSMDISQLKAINSAESFARPGSATEARRQLHALYDLDASQEEKIKEILDNLRQTMGSEASSTSERESMLQGFDKGTAEAAAKRAHALAAEKTWIDAVDDLYVYAEMHPGSFNLSNGHLIIPDAVVRNEFNAKMEFQGDQRKAFLNAQKEFSQFQGQSLDKLGLTPRDMGAK